jgi:hypothetical protein
MSTHSDKENMYMKPTLLFTVITFTLVSFKAFASSGPTAIGPIHIGMSKAKYISVTGIKPVNCNTTPELIYNKPAMAELSFINPVSKTLCRGDYTFRDKGGSLENIQIKGFSYDVIKTGYSSSPFFESIGNSSEAFFIKDKLIHLKITFPEVSYKVLEAKYGEPKLVDNRSIEVCTNGMGNKFNNNVGNLDAVWVNGKANAIFRAHTSSPYKTCTDGSTLSYYILEEPKKFKLIENAINKYLEEISKETANNSPF